MNRAKNQGSLKKIIIAFSTYTCLLCLLLPSVCLGIEKPGEELGDVGLADSRGTIVSGDLRFLDSKGREVTLGDEFARAPATIIVPAYYSCPRLCGLTQTAVATLLSNLKLEMGKDFNVLTVSFDVKDSPERAASKKDKYTGKIEGGRFGGEKSWKFLTGKSEAIDTLMGQLGFKYKEDGGEFAHTSAIYVVTKTGAISQYFSGVEFSPWDVRLSLVDASHGRVGNAIDQVLLYCFRFDPLKGRYTWAVVGLMRGVGSLTLLGLVWLIVGQLRKERLKEVAQ